MREEPSWLLYLDSERLCEWYTLGHELVSWISLTAGVMSGNYQCMTLGAGRKIRGTVLTGFDRMESAYKAFVSGCAEPGKAGVASSVLLAGILPVNRRRGAYHSLPPVIISCAELIENIMRAMWSSKLLSALLHATRLLTRAKSACAAVLHLRANLVDRHSQQI